MRKQSKHLLLIMLTGLAAYSNTTHVPFQFDDSANILENPVLQRLENFFLSLKGYSYNPRRFIGYLTFALNYHFGGASVVGYHLVNLAVHLTTAVLVYFFVLRTFSTPMMASGVGDSYPDFTGSASPRLVALFSALLFVSHPVQTQAVTYTVQRFTSLTAMFYLLSVVMYIQGRLLTEKAGSGRGEVITGEGGEKTEMGVLSRERNFSGHFPDRFMPLFFFVLSLVFAVFAMMTKEIAFTLPIMIALYEFIFFRSSLKKKLLFLLPLGVTLVIIPIGIIGTHKPLGEIISDLSAKTRVQTNIPRWDYLMTELRVITTYIRLLFLPVNQNLDYDYPIAHSLMEKPVLLSFMFLLAILGAAIYLLLKASSKRRGAAGKNGLAQGGEQENMPLQAACGPLPVIPVSAPSPVARCLLPLNSFYRLAAFGVFWFFIALSVESSFIPIVDVIFEHRVYLPSVGAFIAFTSIAYAAMTKTLRDMGGLTEKAFASFFSVVVVFLCLATYTRNTVWGSEMSLWEDVTKKSPNNARAYNNLGYIYLGKGQTDEALGYFVAALRLRPLYADALDNEGVVLYEKGLFDAAVNRFMKAVALMPDVADFHHNLGLTYIRMGLFNDAVAEFEVALRLSPDSYEIYNDMGVTYRQQGYIDKAIESFEKAIALKSDYAGAHYNLGLAYESRGMSDRASEQLLIAHDLDPQRF